MTAEKTNARLPEMIIPIMPCADIKAQVAFYKELGFEVLGLYTAPNQYAALKWKHIELHFWGSRRVVPSQNSMMCYLRVGDVEEVNRVFTLALKKHYGKVPRTGLPKITKVRNLVDDRRFTLTDPGGNTFYIGTPATEEDRFFRTLDNVKYAKLFAALYDVVYSKEDPALAESMLPKYTEVEKDLEGVDRAKYLVLVADIQKYLAKEIEDKELKALLERDGIDDAGWNRIRDKYKEILNMDEGLA